MSVQISNKQQRLKEAVEHIKRHHGIYLQKDLAEKIRITRPALSAAINGNEAYLTDNLFSKICAAFPGVFNLDYFIKGDGSMLTPEEDAVSNDIEKGVAIPTNTLPQSTSLDQSSLVNASIAAYIETIAALKRELSTKDNTIARLQSDAAARLADKDALIATLRSQLSDKDAVSDSLRAQLKDKDALIATIRAQASRSTNSLTDYPFPVGTAEPQNKIRGKNAK